MRGREKAASTLAMAGLICLVLTACGGGAETSSSAPVSPTTSVAEPTTGAAGESGGEKAKGGTGEGAAGGGGEAGSRGEGTESGGAAESGGSAKEAGGSRGFIVPGGDNSVPNFGEEASGSERRQASRELQRYLEARATGHAKAACAALSAEAVEQVEGLSATLPGAESSSCAAVMRVIVKRTPASERSNTMTGPVASLRIEGNEGFALYHGTKGTDYTIPMAREGATWKVAGLMPFPLA